MGRQGAGQFAIYEIVEPGDENTGMGEVLKRVAVVEARGSDEADRLWRERLQQNVQSGAPATEGAEAVEYRCLPMSAVGAVYWAEPQVQVAGGRRR